MRCTVKMIAVTAALLGPAVSAPAALGAGADNYRLKAGRTSSVRNYHGDFIIGNAFAKGTAPGASSTQHFVAQSYSGQWMYGQVADGSVGRWGGLPACGWVLRDAWEHASAPGSASARCPSPRPRDSRTNPLAPGNIFVGGSYLYGTGGGTVYPAQVTGCPVGTFVYGNYDPSTGRFSNRYGQLPVGRGTRVGSRGAPSGYEGFGIRYVAGPADNDQAVLIKDSARDLGGRSPASEGHHVPTWVFMRRACIGDLGPLFSAGLHITGTRWHGSFVRVSGRAAHSLPGRIVVAFACSNGHTSRSVHPRRGRWSLRLRVPAHCRRAHRANVAAAYRGDRRYRAALDGRRVARH